MHKIAVDIETDGLLRDLSTIHCIVAIDLDTQEVFKFDGLGVLPSIKHGLKLIAEADEIWAHNGIGYDLEAIKELYPRWTYTGKVYDTLILSRLFFTDILNRDFRSKPANMPAQLYGRHSLESWGYRLGVLKSEFGKNLAGDWSVYSPEMLIYCQRDVEVTVSLIKMFQPKLEQYQSCIDREHQSALLMSYQERLGFPFDITEAHKLEGQLRTELETISEEMRSTFNYVDGGSFIPKRPDKNKGYVAGSEFCRLKEFSPTSRSHIAWAFMTHRGWKPTDLTDTGKPKIDESILTSLNTPESLAFARILMLQKHLGQLSEGKNSWLKKVDAKGRIHHSCVLNTNTGRNAHMNPNLGQVPSGEEYRRLFHAGPNRVFVGADASGLELRCLAHYLHPFEGGVFAKELLEGDIHQKLADIYGVDRRTSKTITYCLIYGGGDAKLGISAGEKDIAKAQKRGKEIRKKVLANLNGYAELTKALATRAETGVLVGLDGRPIRLNGKNHVALNYLLQSCGAILCKSWVIAANEMAAESGIDYYPLAFIHDEQNWSVAPTDVDKAKQILETSIIKVRDLFDFRIPLDAEAKQGMTWSEVH